MSGGFDWGSWAAWTNLIKAGAVGSVGGTTGALATGSTEAIAPGTITGQIDSLTKAPDMPGSAPLPSDADIAAREPDKERLRRQRMAALMMQGRSGTIGGSATGNIIGSGSGKALIGQ